jgi:isopentenyl phosphate kinase
MRKPLIVVKLGGSALTDKERIFTPRAKEIHRAAEQVARLRKRFSLVVVHGAGSYGHIPVRQWRLESGLRNRRQLEGLAATKSKLLEWEEIFDRVFLKHQIPLIPLLASDFVVTRKGRISAADLRPFRNWLSINCVPSTGGDIVSDLKNGFSVLSGDQLAAYLAVQLKASRLVFGTDVDGIFSADPKHDPHARIIRELTSSTALDAAARARVSDTPDVTGGMAGKIIEARRAASNGIPVYFVNLTVDNRLANVGLDREVLCSKILPS